MKELFFVIIITCTLSCQTEIKNMSDQEFTTHQAKNNLQQPGYWDHMLERPLEKRILSQSNDIIKYIQDDNIINGYLDIPKKVILNKRQRKIISSALNNLPKSIKQSIQKKIAGIAFIQGLGSSAFTDFLKSYKKMGFIIFDLKVLTMTANQWCSWKENSAFKNGEYKIKCTIEDDETNNAEGAFRYIFLHEVGHILTIDSSFMPFYHYHFTSIKDFKRYPFLNLSWEYQSKNLFSIKDKSLNFKDISYYIPAKSTKNDSMIKHYTKLNQSDFATLYSTINPWDDLAEGYVNYIHTQILKKPFKIEIFKGNNIVYTYNQCWQHKRCQKKKKYIIDFINN